MASSLSMIRVAQIFSIGAAAWVAGNIGGLSLVAVPTLQQSRAYDGVSASTVAKQWHRLFNAGKAQIPLVAVTGATAFSYLAWMSRSGSRTRLFTGAAMLTVGIVPFTMIFMSATNNRLRGHAEAAATETKESGVSGDTEIEQLVEKWKYLNLTRSLLPLSAFILGAVALL